MADTKSAEITKLPGEGVSVVLVHGAFADGSGWRDVYGLLFRCGYEVLVVQNPTITLEGDVAATVRVIKSARYPVILVGHSYGGAVVTVAGMNEKVQAIVYISAFVPDVGESVASLNEAPAGSDESKAPLLPPQDGYLIVDPEKFTSAFASDIDPEIGRFMAASQVPWGLGAVTGEVSGAAWRSKPAHYLIASKDRMIPPSAQRMMAERAGARIVEIESSHAAMLSHPHEVAAFIEAAAGDGD